MLIDAHCHLTGSYAQGDAEGALIRAREQGVGGFIAVGTDVEDSRAVLHLTSLHAEVQASLGVHPHEAKSWTPEAEQALAEMVAHPAVRFVGETGLDFHYDLSPREVQEAVFRAQIQLAKRVGKPLMIHTRSAAADTLRVLKEEGAEAVGGIIHCFSEDLAFAKGAVALGFHLSFSGILTFKNAEAIREAAAWAPEDRLLVETDAPFLAPVPHRGKPNEPAYVTHTAAALAQLRGLSVSQLADRTTRNMEALCGWVP